MSINISNNLFYYGTSELSQDAFICYLLSFVMDENSKNDTELLKCARELLKNMGINDEKIVVTDIKRQYKNIDVLVEVNKKHHIIVEDKTFTSQRNGQINRYKNILEEEGKENIICVYYKIVEQAHPEEDVINLTRKDLLNIFTKYKTEDKVFNDYVEYLEWIDIDINSYKELPIEKWTGHSYKGFFSHLVEDGIIDKSRGYGWDYVPNAKGGFMGLWWHGLTDNNVFENREFNKYINNIYLQIEDNIITVKLEKSEVDDKVEINNIRWKLYEYFNTKLPEFTKKAFRDGKYMTVGYIDYDYNNYKEKIELLEYLMKGIEDKLISI